MRTVHRCSLLATTVAAGALLPAAALADPAPKDFASLSPTTAGAASHLLLDAKGAAGGFSPGQLPSGLTIALQKGFTFDPTAVAATCANADADKDQCPADSQFASGTIVVTGSGSLFGPGGQTIPAQVRFFRGEPQQAGDPAGAVFSFVEPSSGFHGASRGRVMTSGDIAYGTEISFDKLPLPPLPKNLHFSIDELKLDIGAGSAASTPATPAPSKKKKVKKKRVCKTKKVHGKRKRLCWNVRVKSSKKKSSQRSAHIAARRHANVRDVAAGGSLIVNPTSCLTGAWSVRMTVTAPDGVQVRDAAAPCSG
jgi:hypothetical protein